MALQDPTFHRMWLEVGALADCTPHHNSLHVFYHVKTKAKRVVLMPPPETLSTNKEVIDFTAYGIHMIGTLGLREALHRASHSVVNLNHLLP